MGSVPQLSILKGRTRTLNPKQLHRIFEETVKKHPSEIAILFEENGITRKHTYLELDNMTNSLARVIRQNIDDNNIPRNDDGDFVVAVSMHPTDYLVITLLSIWKSGAAYLPLDPSFPQSRVEHIIREAKPALVIFEEDKGYFFNTFKISRNTFFNAASTYPTTSLNDEETLKHLKNELALLLYTSGSTGSPKGVRLPHAMLLNRLQWQFKTFPYSETEKTCVFKTALTFVDSISEIWGPLLNGLAVLVVPKSVTQNPEQLVPVLEKYKIERLVLVPSLLRSLLMYFTLHERRFLQNLRTWVCSGETLVVSLAKEFYKYFSVDQHKLCNFYGSTEIMGDVTYHVITNPEQLNSEDKIPIGLPIDNTIIYLFDSDFRPVRTGDIGELFVAGANLADGYVNGRDPDKFIDNPLAVDPAYMKLYRTGDFARIAKGTVVYEGRTDSQIKVRGHRVDLAEVDKAVNALEGIDKAVVLCYKPGEINQTILAFVLTDVSSLSEHVIETMLKSTLPSYMVPQVILIDVIPLLVNGKIDRQALFKYYETSDDNNNDDENFQVEIDYTGVPERQKEAAKVLFETIATVLTKSARKAISTDANFYEIGGNSLNSIYTITCLKEHGYHISIGDFIAAVDLGEILDRMSPEKQEQPILITQPPCYSAELLQDEHKKDVIDIITSSFYQKADLEQWIITEISESDYEVILETIWNDLKEKQLSFIVKTENGKSVGVSLSFDARDEPEVVLDSRLMVIFELLENVEGPIRESHLPEGKGKILHSFMMGTNSSLTPKENVAVIQFMEEEVVRLAKTKSFAGILTTNTNPLTQQFCTNVYGYKTFLDYQVNQFVASDDTRPFGLAPDSQRALVQWKEV